MGVEILIEKDLFIIIQHTREIIPKWVQTGLVIKLEIDSSTIP